MPNGFKICTAFTIKKKKKNSFVHLKRPWISDSASLCSCLFVCTGDLVFPKPS